MILTAFMTAKMSLSKHSMTLNSSMKYTSPA